MAELPPDLIDPCPSKRSHTSRVVVAERPRCPVCASPDLKATRTMVSGPEYIQRRVVCRVCGTPFVLVLD